MARPRNELPQYRRHRVRNCGRTSVGTEEIFFPGEYGSSESKAAYQAWLAHYLATARYGRPGLPRRSASC